MRTKSTKQQYLDFSRKSRLKVVNEYRKKYKILSQLLDKNPQLVSLVHQDLARMLSKSALRNNLWVSSQSVLEWAKQFGAPQGKITPLASIIWPCAQTVLPIPGEIFFVYQKIFHKNTT